MGKILGNRWIFILILVGGGWFGYSLLYKPFFGANVQTAEGDQVEFYIPTGFDYRMVGNKLLEEKLIRDPESFHWLAEQMNYPNHVYPGRYILENGMSTRDLITLLRSGKREPITFTFVKFRTKEDLAAYVGEQFEMSAKDLLEVLNDAEFLRKHNGLTPELALMAFIPNTYEMHWHIKPKDFFERMFKEYKRFWNETRDAQRRKLNLNRREIMTVASIVEEETNKNDEKSTIAGVYLNRVRKGWPLEADPTVKYAVGDFTLRRILNKHLKVQSPYNTYQVTGIPPGPICTPSIASIDAVLKGERHKYMFFCAKADGSGYHAFSETLAQHLAYAREFHDMLNRQGIK